MHSVDAERATRRAQVVAALADAVAIVDRAPPIHVAVDGFADPATASWSTTWVVSWPDAAAAATGCRWTRSASFTALDAGCGTGRALPRLPLPEASVDGGFAAGLLPHLPDPGLGLTELARVIRLGGRLAVFHPSGRAALAARHGRRPRDEDLLAPDRLRRLLRRTCWRLDRYDDGRDRFLAVTERVSPSP